MTSDTLNIMILAAGLGERLRPITDRIPKPLVPVLGVPVLQLILDKVSSIPYEAIGINLHHNAKALEQWVSRCSFKDRIVLFPEPSILGTGGALKNAESLLDRGMFLVHNGDILSDIDLPALVRHHRASDNLATLAVHDFPRFNNVTVDENGLFKELGRPASEGRTMAFTGIAVYEPGFLDFLPQGESSVVDAWTKAVSAGEKIGTCDVTGAAWSDLGTPESYSAAVFSKLRKEGESLYIHPSVQNCHKLDITGNVVLEEGAAISGALTLRNCIVLPGAVIEGNTVPSQTEKGGILENCIAGPDFTVHLDEMEIVCMKEGKHLIGTGGSDRNYFRVREQGETAVLMECRQDDADFERHIRLTAFFRERGVPVPELKRFDSAKKQAVFQDAGDLSLYSWLKCPREDRAIRDVYKKVIDGLVRIHRTGTGSAADLSLFQERSFEQAYFRWETDYFMQRFVTGLANVQREHAREIDRELDDLARMAASFPRTLLHRDFQSQNIMIADRETILIIDFQGARTGPHGYDAASLLWDPYVRLNGAVRDDLLRYYMDRMSEACEEFDRDAFMTSLLPCRLQRHMQALGAYGFLAVEKGKKYFLKFVPEALRLLREDLSEAGDAYGALRKLVETLKVETA